MTLCTTGSSWVLPHLHDKICPAVGDRAIPFGSPLGFGAQRPAGPAEEERSDRSEEKPRNVLVTGGNRGIGLAIARAFVAGGDNVVITQRSGRAA